MTDIFREVEEDVRRERLEKLWKQYGDYIIAVVAVVIIAIAGYELWLRYEKSQSEKASSTFTQAMNQIAANPAAANSALEQLSATAPSGYAKLSKLALADAAQASGDRTRAVALYESLGAQDNGPLGSAARIRAAWILADTASKANLQSLLAPLTDPTSAWRQMAREVLAYSDYKNGQLKLAQSEYQALASDADAPQALKRRAAGMAALIKAGGDTNFGYVPPVEKPAQPQGGATPAPTQQGPAPK